MESLEPQNEKLAFYIDEVVTASAHKPWLNLSSSQPFAEFWMPFCDAAWNLHLEKFPRLKILPTAVLDLKNQLLSRLAESGSFALWESFLEFKCVVCPSSLGRANEGETIHYRFFVKFMLDGQLSPFFARFPQLSEIVLTLIEQWVSRVRLFIIRLLAHEQVLRDAFNLNGGFVLRSVSPMLSDPHNGGEGVIAFQLECDKRIIYKPKDLLADAIYATTLQFLSAKGLRSRISHPIFVQGNGFGWSEFVEPHELLNEDEAKVYYFNAGVVLCVLTCLRVSDVHFENIVARDTPVVLDLETMFQPNLLKDKLDFSVLDTGLIPIWEFEAANGGGDIYGLTAQQDTNSGVSYVTWENLASDDIRPVLSLGLYKPRQNIPMLLRAKLHPRKYTSQICDGFAAACDLIQNNVTELVELFRLAKGTRCFKTRLILRSTMNYHALKRNLFSPSFLRGGFENNLVEKMLATHLLLPVFSSAEVLKAERDAIIRMDVPFFCLDRQTNELYEYKRHVSNITAPSSENSDFFVALSSSISALKKDEQLSLIRRSLNLGELIGDAVAVCENRGLSSGKKSFFLNEAGLICETVLGIYTSIINDFGQALGGKNLGLYSGEAGLLLFFAAYYSLTGEKRYEVLIENSLYRIAGSVQQIGESAADFSPNVGMSDGLASAIYSLTKVYEYTGSSLAAALARNILDTTHLVLDRDFPMDVIGGLSGMLLSLCHFYKIFKYEPAKKLAIVVGRIIKEKNQNCAMIETLGLGFSHGVSGVALSLCRLFAICDDKRFLRAAIELARSESQSYCPEHLNWPDSRNRSTSDEFNANGWCHGACGIGLAHFGMHDISPNHFDILNIQRATLSVLRDSQHRFDNLCCGETGHIELLLCSAEVGKISPQHVDAAVAKAIEMVARFRRNGHLRFPMSDNNVGLFSGLAGVGYQLLRVHDPKNIQSVALFE